MQTLGRFIFITSIFGILAFSTPVFANDNDILNQQGCTTCHAISGSPPSTLKELWQRKAPDLFYAGNKYRQAWLESWLQNPKRIRPAGMFYMNHIKPGAKRNMIDKSTLTQHVKLNASDAKKAAQALASLKSNTSLIDAEKHDAKISPGPLGEMMFDKIYGCMACHQIEPGYGGLSGPELYTAGKRLTPEFMLSFIRSPQAWDTKTWMPNSRLPDNNMQKLVNYIIALSKENFDE